MNRHRMSVISWAAFAIFAASAGESSAKTFYLDSALSAGCTSGNYSVSSRSCSGSDGVAYKTLQEAVANLAGGDTLYIRAGTYVRNGGSELNGALNVSVPGADTSHRTTVSAYTGEELQAIIGTDPSKLQYNPDPSQGFGGNVGLSAAYYPCPAITIGASYVTVRGLKTYGQLLVQGTSSPSGFIHDILVENCDIGGGGPRLQQGQTVMLHSCKDTTIRNNRIHHSCRAIDGLPGDSNGYALMGYWFSATIENNEFYDNWCGDIRLKDARSQQGNNTIIRNNFFRNSTIYSATTGIDTGAQYMELDYTYIYNNIFFEKSVGISWILNATFGTLAYNNTFINCGKDVFTWQSSNKINVFNNISYHSQSGQLIWNFESSSYPMSDLLSDYNLYYSTSSAGWKKSTSLFTSLSAWQSYSGKDLHSVSKNPNFVNPSGARPEDFKRTSYVGDVSGSPYGAVSGAYQTGLEVIGTGGSYFPPPPLPSPVKIPNAPSNVTIQ